jgi:hypothetical protein
MNPPGFMGKQKQRKRTKEIARKLTRIRSLSHSSDEYRVAFRRLVKVVNTRMNNLKEAPHVKKNPKERVAHDGMKLLLEEAERFQVWGKRSQSSAAATQAS